MANRATYGLWGGPLLGLANLALVLVVTGFVLGSGVGAFSAVVLVPLVWSVWLTFFGSAYKGAITDDGELWFKGILREWRCPVERVIDVKENSGEGAWYYTIRTPSGRVRIPQWRSDEIVIAILAANPEIRVRNGW